jgi:hypothetical protein
LRSLDSPVSSDEKSANGRRRFYLHPANARVCGCLRAGSAINLSIPRASLFERSAAEVICSSPGRYPRLLLQPTVALRTAEAVQLVQSGLDQEIPVYALLFSSKDIDQDVKRLPLIHGYRWKQSEKSNSRAVILTLTKDVVASTLDSTSRSVQ